MSNVLIEQVTQKYNVTRREKDMVCFECKGEEFCIIGDTIYLCLEDRFPSAGTKVRSIKSVDKFVAART